MSESPLEKILRLSAISDDEDTLELSIFRRIKTHKGEEKYNGHIGDRIQKKLIPIKSGVSNIVNAVSKSVAGDLDKLLISNPPEDESVASELQRVSIKLKHGGISSLSADEKGTLFGYYAQSPKAVALIAWLKKAAVDLPQ